jgi:hypothetical protein
MNFINNNIFLIYTKRIIVRNKIIKIKHKKQWRDNFTNRIVKFVGKTVGKLWTLFIMSITKGIIDEKFRRYFPESSGIIHFPIALLIIVLYKQNHQRI